jgi:hypothetical protein
MYIPRQRLGSQFILSYHWHFSVRKVNRSLDRNSNDIQNDPSISVMRSVMQRSQPFRHPINTSSWRGA